MRESVPLQRWFYLPSMPPLKLVQVPKVAIATAYFIAHFLFVLLIYFYLLTSFLTTMDVGLDVVMKKACSIRP